jgi:hypothetical protein
VGHAVQGSPAGSGGGSNTTTTTTTTTTATATTPCAEGALDTDAGEPPSPVAAPKTAGSDQGVSELAWQGKPPRGGTRGVHVHVLVGVLILAAPTGACLPGAHVAHHADAGSGHRVRVGGAARRGEHLHADLAADMLRTHEQIDRGGGVSGSRAAPARDGGLLPLRGVLPLPGRHGAGGALLVRGEQQVPDGDKGEQVLPRVRGVGGARPPPRAWRILRRSYQISLHKTGTRMGLRRLAPCAGTWCCGRVDLRSLSSLDIAFACSSIFGGRLDSCLDCGTCGTVAPREEDGLTCTELILTSLAGWPVVAGLRPTVTSPAALHRVLDDLDISPTSTHYIASQVRGKRLGNDGGRFIGQTPCRDFSKASAPPPEPRAAEEQQQQRRPGKGKEKEKEKEKEKRELTTTTTTTTAAAAAARKSVAKNV